jgi:lipoate synthase
MARIKQMNKTIYAKEPIIVRGLAEQIGIKIYQLMHDLMDMNIYVSNINQSIRPEVASVLCAKYGFKLIVTDPREPWLPPTSRQ